MSNEDDTTSSNPVLADTASDHDRLTWLVVTVKGHGKQLSKIQGDIRWAVKIILTVVFLAILSGVVIKQLPAQSQNQNHSSSRHSAAENDARYGPLPSDSP